MALADQLAQGVQFAAPIDPFAQYGKMQQLQAGQTQNALAQYQLGQAQRTDQEANALRQSLPVDFDPTNPSHVNALLRASPVGGAALVEKLAKVRTENLVGQKTQSDIDTAKLKQQQDIAKIGGSILYGVNDQASYDKAVDALKRIGGPSSVSDYPTQFDPNFVQTEIRKGQDLEKELDRMQPIPMRAGGSLWNPKTQQFEATAPIEPTPLLPKDVEAQKVRIALASRPPVQPVAPTIATIQDPTNPSQMISINAREYRGGGMGSPGVIGLTGKTPAAAAKQEAVEKGQAQVSSVIDDLRASYDTLDKAAAIPSTQRGTLSNLAASAQASGMGQALGRMGGTEEQSARDVINSSRMMLLNSIKQATGMSAQQLNSNVELTSWLKAVSDPTQSIETVNKILGNIEKFVETGGKYSVRKEGTPAGAPKPTAAAPNIDALLNKYK